MTLYAGIDIGTSGIKVVLADADDRVQALATRQIAVDRPHPGWSQQHPDLWWQATCAAFDQLAARHPGLMPRIRGIGVSGQMLGAVLLDRHDRPVHSCLLWNDQRSQSACTELLRRVPDMGLRTAGNPDPGFTAPKLLWLAKHLPSVLERADVVMLPKDYVRLCLTGERASEPSDGAGTLMLDCATRAWDAELAGAAGWDLARLPRIVASHAEAGRLRRQLQSRWGIAKPVCVAAGAGDNMACALGVGVTAPGDAVVTLGTSAVLCAVDADFHPAPQAAILTNPHAAPGTFLSMGVVMSATQSLDWISGLCGRPVAQLADGVAAMVADIGIEQAPVMRPSLTGIRTPDNRPDAGASVLGIGAGTDATALAYAVIEGVAFQLFECLVAQRRAGVPIDNFTIVGGGARNRLWIRLIATLLGSDIVVPKGGGTSAARGAARLARVACGDGCPAGVLSQKPADPDTVEPDRHLGEALERRFRLFRTLPK